MRVQVQATKALRYSRVYTAGEHTLSPMATCGGATRIQLRASARRAVKVLIPLTGLITTYNGNPLVDMRTGAGHADVRLGGL